MDAESQAGGTPARTPSRVELPDTFRELGPVDVEPIVRVLTSLSEQFWTVEDARKDNDFVAFHHTQHLILRFLPDRTDLTSWYERPLWTMLRGVVEPVMLRSIERYELQDPVFPKVMFARLAAHAVIDRHTDTAASDLWTHKIHVPIISHPDTTFEIGQTRRHLRVGNAYEVNNIKPHAVENPADTDRIHLIFEVFDNAE